MQPRFNRFLTDTQALLDHVEPPLLSSEQQFYHCASASFGFARLRDLAPLKGFPPLKALDPLTALYPLSADGSLPTKGSSRQAFRARRETGKPSDFANFLICRRLPQINSPWATNRPTTTTPQCAPKVMA